MTWQRYILAFIITAAIFGTAFYIAARIDNQRIAEIRSTEDAISIDILSSETQFELLGNTDCQTLQQNPVLSDELNSLASQLQVAEQNLGDSNPEVIQLKDQYSLLEIKDYVLLQNITQKCGGKPVYILYFYSNAGDCPQCSQMGDVLTYLRNQYPGLRVYAFDYHLDLSALSTLKTLNKLNGTLPALIINNRPPVYGFQNLDQMKVLVPELATLATTTSATSTTSTTIKK
ncbi:MAG TPA: hypothetical protein VN665_03695 [Candidatus Paceibacterota bacterium]|nr:hypothetical protein [Candidatus Paceibacterota bacterium]